MLNVMSIANRGSSIGKMTTKDQYSNTFDYQSLINFNESNQLDHQSKENIHVLREENLSLDQQLDLVKNDSNFMKLLKEFITNELNLDHSVLQLVLSNKLDDLAVLNEELLSQIELFFQSYFEEMEEKETNRNFINVYELNVNTDFPNQEIIHDGLVERLKEIGHLLQQGMSNRELKSISSRLLAILHEWSHLKNQTNEEQINRIVTTELTKEEVDIWKQLVNAFEKRRYFTENNMYRSESVITRTDVLNWLQQAFENHMLPAETVNQTVTSQQPLLMNEIQQYTIHVQNIGRVEPVSNELIQKFHHIIRDSRFMQQNNVNQLSIMLKPENLGNMTVRLMQIDGEMSVKIIVTTQIARDMLESNLHQLKSMFSPHQIVIERDETISDKEFFREEQKQEENEQDDSFNENDPSENKEDETETMKFQELFQQLSEEEI